MFAAEEPRARNPGPVFFPPQGHDVTHNVVEAVGVDFGETVTFLLVVEFRVEDIDIARQAALAPKVIPDILVARQDVLGGDAESGCQGGDEALGVIRGVAVILVDIGEQGIVVPERLTIPPPPAAVGPAGQGFSGIPFSLAMVEQAVRGKLRLEPAQQRAAEFAFVRAHRGEVPLLAFHVVNADESRLSAHGQPDITGHKFAVDLVADGFNIRPLRFGIGFGDAGRFHHAADFHVMGKLRLTDPDGAADRGGRAGVRRAGQGNVAFTREQAGGGIKAHPARPGQIDFHPRVEIGEIHLGAGRPVEGFDVRSKLDQVTADKPGGQSLVAQQLHHEEGGVAAGTGLERQGLLRSLHTGFQPDAVLDVVGEAGVEIDQILDGAAFGAVDGVVVFGKGEAAGIFFQEGTEFLGGGRFVGEGKFLGIFLEEKVEGIKHRQFRHEVHLNGEFRERFFEIEAGEVIGKGILLPVQEMLASLDLQRVGNDRGAAVGGRPQADDVGTVHSGPVVFVSGAVGKGDVDGHCRTGISRTSAGMG